MVDPPPIIFVDGYPEQAPEAEGLFRVDDDTTSQRRNQRIAPDVMRSRYVEIVFDQLGSPNGPPMDGSGKGETLALNLFEDASYTAILDRVEQNRAGRYSNGDYGDSYTWIGHLQEEPDSLVVLVVRGDALYGTISTERGNYTIQRLREVGRDGGALHAILQTNPSYYAFKNPQDGLPAFDDPTSPTKQNQKSPSKARRQRSGTLFENVPDNGSVVDILVVYSDDFVELPYTGSTEAAVTLIELYVAYTNAALARSNVDLQVNLVHQQEIEYEEWTEETVEEDENYLGKDLDDLYQGRNGLEVVHELRDTYHADQVTMLFGNGGGGLAYVTNFEPNTQWLAFAAVGCLAVCDYIYAHEVGHSLGATHDWYSSGMGGTARTYGHGHSNVEKRFRTLMAYGTVCIDIGSGCPVVPYYSNPDLSHNNAPLGVPADTNDSCTREDEENYQCDADNRRMFNETSPIIAGYRSSEIVWTGAVSNAWQDAENWEM